MMQKIKDSLVIKIALLFGFAALLPYLLVSIVSLYTSKDALHEEIVNGMKVKTGLMRDALDARLFLLRENAIAWAGFEVMNDLLIDDIDKRITGALERLKEDYGISGEIYTLNGKGVVVAAGDPSFIGKEISDGWLKDVLAGKTVQLDSHASPFTGEKVISFCVPIRQRIGNQETIGALLFEQNLDDLKKNILSAAMPLSAIIDNNGNVVTATDAMPDVKGDFLSLIKDGKDTVFYRNGHIFAMGRSKGYYDFKGFGWFVVGAVEEEKALNPVRRIEKASATIGITGIFLIIGLISFFSARSVRPLKELSRMAEYIARTKDLSSRIRPTTTDEIGRLADAFNHMIEEVNNHVHMLLKSNIEMIEVLGSAIAKRDSDTNIHNYRVTIISIRLAEAIGLNKKDIQSLIKGSFLHDIGKIGISDTILLKKERLTDDEFEAMKDHVEHGTDIISRYKWLTDAVDIVRCHHEKYDGSGYNTGLKGEEIPLSARIFAIADVFDALTSLRPYKKPLPYEKAMEIIEEGRGGHFDPKLLDVFEKVSPDIYSEISSADDKALEDILNGLIIKYFYET